MFNGHCPIQLKLAAPFVFTVIPSHIFNPAAQLAKHLPVPQLNLAGLHASSPIHLISTSDAPCPKIFASVHADFPVQTIVHGSPGVHNNVSDLHASSP